MKKTVLGIAIACVSFAASAAYAACLSDAEIEASVGDQVRAGAPFITAETLVGRPLCSGVSLAQKIQHMHEVAFPEERIAREKREAQQRDLEEADAAADDMMSTDLMGEDTMPATADAEVSACGPDDDAMACNADATMSSTEPVSKKAHRARHKHSKKRH